MLSAEARLETLFDRRGTVQRQGAAPMESVSELTDWIDSCAVVLVSGRSALPNAAEAIAGRSIRGSWWGDPLGSLIFRLLTELEEGAREHLDLVLVDGKRTVISPRLVPVVRAVAADPGRRGRVADTLSTPSLQLLAALEEGREVRSDDPGPGLQLGPKARRELEAGLLARSVSVHTAAGHHVSVLQTYGGQPAPAPAEAGRFEPHLEALLAAALSAAVVADEREVRKWLRFVEPDGPRRATAVSALGAEEIRVGGTTWLTLGQGSLKSGPGARGDGRGGRQRRSQR